jgi:hypothetical protein
VPATRVGEEKRREGKGASNVGRRGGSMYDWKVSLVNMAFIASTDYIHYLWLSVGTGCYLLAKLIEKHHDSSRPLS